MSNFKSQAKYVRIPPRKARLAADLIRGLPVNDALVQLQFSQMKAGRCLKKVLDTAIADAAMLASAKKENLVVSEVRVDEGPSFKRAKAKSRGGRAPILKRTSHFTVTVSSVLQASVV